jgi:hypothetical protein
LPTNYCIHTNKSIYLFPFFVHDVVAMFVGFTIEDFSFYVLLLAMCSIKLEACLNDKFDHMLVSTISKYK